MGVNESVGRDRYTPLPPRGGRRRGFAEHCSAPPQPARDAARAVEGVGGEGASMPSQMSAEQTDRFGDVLSQGFDEFVCNDGPLSPNPSPARGEG